MPEFLSLSFVEILIILFLAFLLLKPTEIQSVGKWFGKMLREIISSDVWKMVQQTSREFRGLPNRLMREANDELNSLKIPPRPQPISPLMPISTPHTSSKDQSQASSSDNVSRKDEEGKNA